MYGAIHVNSGVGKAATLETAGVEYLAFIRTVHVVKDARSSPGGWRGVFRSPQ